MPFGGSQTSSDPGILRPSCAHRLSPVVDLERHRDRGVLALSHPKSMLPDAGKHTALRTHLLDRTQGLGSFWVLHICKGAGALCRTSVDFDPVLAHAFLV